MTDTDKRRYKFVITYHDEESLKVKAYDRFAEVTILAFGAMFTLMTTLSLIINGILKRDILEELLVLTVIIFITMISYIWAICKRKYKVIIVPKDSSEDHIRKVKNILVIELKNNYIDGGDSN